MPVESQRDPGDDALARELIRARQERGSLAIVQAGLVVIVVALPFLIYVGIAVNAELAMGLSAAAAVFCAYLVGMRWLMRRGLYRPWHDWINATLEIVVGVAVVAVDAEFQGPAYAFSSSPAYLLPTVVMASAVRLRRALSLYTGVLAGTLYLAVYLAYRDGLSPELLAALPSLETWNIVQRSCFMVFTGFVAYLICQLMRRSVVELVSSVRERLIVERTLGRHVSREVAELLVDGQSADGEEREVTVLFADIRKFTSFSERRAPADVVAMLNAYFDMAATAVERHGGIVNKFTGDGLMALFGAPVASDEHAAQAARAGREMVDGMARLGEQWRGRLGVGIHTGRAVVGTVGTETRAEYTAIGDAVNVAARVEQLNKDLDTEILVSEDTARALGDAATLVRIGEVQVRGRDEPVVVHRLEAVAPAVRVTAAG